MWLKQCVKQFSTTKSPVLPFLINRNPRNLELLNFAPKTQGWEFQYPSKKYWNKCVLQRTRNNTSAAIVHTSGFTVIEVSTVEPAIREQLYSTVDVSAAQNIGRILATRCKKAGILNVFFDTVEQPLTSDRIRLFYEAMLEGGISLEEPEDIPQPVQHGIDYDALTREEQRALYPSLLDELRTTPDWGHQKYPFSMRPKAKKSKSKGKHQVLAKVREGQWWNRIYNRMAFPEDRPHWMDDPDVPPFVQQKSKHNEK